MKTYMKTFLLLIILIIELNVNASTIKFMKGQGVILTEPIIQQKYDNQPYGITGENYNYNYYFVRSFFYNGSWTSWTGYSEIPDRNLSPKYWQYINPINFTTKYSIYLWDNVKRIYYPSNEIILHAGRINGGYIGPDQTICKCTDFKISGSITDAMPQYFDYKTNNWITYIDFNPTWIYEWQYFDSKTQQWIAFPNSNISVYTVQNVCENIKLRRKVIVTYINSCEEYSNEITVTVTDPLAGGKAYLNNVNTTSANVCYGVSPGTIRFDNPTGGKGNIINQLRAYKPSWGEFNITSSYITPLTGQNENSSYHLVSTNDCGTVQSEKISLTLYSKTNGGSIGSDQTICYGSTPQILTNITEGSGGTSNLKYEWYSSLNNSSYTLISGANSNSYQPPALNYTIYYKRKTKDNSCEYNSTFSNIVKITVRTNFIVGSISSYQSICYNSQPSTFTGTLPTGSDGIYTYQWYSTTGDPSVASNWTNAISGATSSTYQADKLTTTTYFRRKDFNSCNTSGLWTNYSTVIVSPNFVVGSLIGTQTICYNTIPTKIDGSTVQAAGGTISYKWYYTIGDATSGTYTEIPGATGEDFTQVALTSSISFKRKDYDNKCNINGTFTNPVTITVNPQFKVGAISDNQTICKNSTPNAIIGSLPTSGGGAISYEWYSSNNNVVYNKIISATSKDYQPSVLNTATYFKRKDIDNLCKVTGTETNSILINTYNDLSAGSISGSTSICYATQPATFSSVYPTGGTGSNYSYKWFSTTGDPNVISNFSNEISGATSSTYQADALTQTTHFRRKVFNSCNNTGEWTNYVTINVFPQINKGTITSTNQAICYNTAPPLINTTLASGGNGTYNYQWQKSIDNINWGNISGATSSSYQPSSLLVSTYFRRALIEPSCGTFYTEPILFTVYSNFVQGNISTDILNICYNTKPNKIIGTTPTGGTGIYTYQWQRSTDGGQNWTNIIGATNNEYSPTELIVNTSFRRIDINTCNPSGIATNIITIYVYNQFNPGYISSNQTICSGTQASEITGSSATGGDEDYSYKWQNSNNGSTWIDINNANNESYNPGIITNNTWFRRIDKGYCGSDQGDETNSILISVYPSINAGTLTNINQTVCYNSAPEVIQSTLPSGGTGNYSYNWIYSTDNINWNSIIDASYNLQPLTNNVTTYYKRIDNDGCSQVSTNVATVNFYNPFISGEISGNQYLCNNEVPTNFIGSIPSGGTGNNYNYQWQKSIDNINWNNIIGANSKDYQSDNLNISTYFRRKDINTCDIKYTLSILNNVYQIFTPGTISSDQTVDFGFTPNLLTGTGPSGGDGVYNYQWESSIDNSIWNTIGGATALNYQPGALTVSTYYRRFDKSGSCNNSVNKEKYTNQIIIEVYGQFTAGTITGSDNLCYNSTPTKITGLPPTGGDGNYSYEWQKSNDGVSWGTISGANNIDYQPGMLTLSTYYRRVDKNLSHIAYTRPVKINVYSIVEAGTIEAEKYNLCYNEKPALLIGSSPIGGVGTFSYQWQKLGIDGFTWSNIANATSASYQPGNLNSSIVYRRKETNNCGVTYSNNISLNVYNQFNTATITGAENICYNSTPSLISGQEATGGDGVYYYQWQKSNDNSVWTDIAGANDATYQDKKLRLTTYYKRKDENLCGIKTTNVIAKNVYEEYTSGQISNQAKICYNTTPSLISGTDANGGDGVNSHQWQKSTNEITWNNITGATGLDYLPPALTIPTYYRRNDINSCGSTSTNKILIDVYDNYIVGSITGEQSVCYNETPTVFNSFSPIGGTGIYTYQWQVSNDNVTFGNISGAVSESYQSGKLLQNKYYRRIDKSGTCGNLITNTIFVQTYNNLIAGTISANQTICYNSIPTKLIGTEAAGGDGFYNYQWESSLDNNIYEEIPGAIEKDYQPAKLNISTYYRRKDINNCKILYTNKVLITVYTELTQSSISGNQTICYNNTPSAIFGSFPNGGDGSYNYVWQNSENGIVWNNLPSSNNKDYQPLTLTKTLYYRRIDYNMCGNMPSNNILITVYPKFEGGAIIDNQSVCYNSIPSQLTGSIPSGGTGTYSYQWQSSNTNTNDWINLPGFVGANYQAGNLTSTKYYRRIDQSGSCGKDTTNILIISAYSQFIAGTITGTQSACYNSQPTIFTGTISTGSDELYSYQWQKSIDNSTWVDIPAANSKDYQSTSLTQTTYFKRKDISNCGTLFTNTIVVTIYNDVVSGSISSSQTICYNTSPLIFAGTNTTGGTGTTSYQWENSDNSVNWNDITGATSKDYQSTALTDKKYFRRKSINTCKIDYSNVIEITVRNPLIAGEITEDQNICYSTAPTKIVGTIAIGGTESYTYQWQVSSDNINYSNIISAVTKDYQPSILTSSKYYRRIDQSGSCGKDTSNTILVNTYPQFIVGNITGTQSICYNSQPSLFNGTPPSGADNLFSFQWQKSLDNSTWNDIPGATNESFQSTQLTQTTYFKRKDISNCSTLNTNTITVTVYSDVIAGTIANDQTICYNSIPSKIVGNVGTGGTGSNYSYKWLKSNNSIVWDTIVGETSKDYQSAVLIENINYRRLTINQCKSDLSNIVTINVRKELVSGIISEDQSICYNTTPSKITGTDAIGGTESYTYQWQSASSNKIFSNIVGAILKDYQPTKLTQNKYYRRIDKSDNCGNDTTNEILITVANNSSVGSIIGRQEVCYGAIPDTIRGVAAIGDDIQYQWESSNDNSNWIKLGGTDIYLIPTALTENTYYRRKDNNNCFSSYTNTIQISVLSNSMPGAITGTQSVCYKTTPIIITSSSPTIGESYTIQWQYSYNGATWYDIKNQNGLNYQPDNLDKTTMYKIKYNSSNCGDFYAAPITVSVYDSLISGKIGENQELSFNTSPNELGGLKPTGGKAQYSFQWLVSDDSLLWKDILFEGNKESYKPNVLKKTAYYKRKVSDYCGTATTNVVKIYILNNVKPGVISDNQKICINSTAKLLTGIKATGGDDKFEYQWQSSKNGTEWTDIILNSSSLDYQPTLLNEDIFYRRKDLSDYATVYSNKVYIDVMDKVKDPVVNINNYYCRGTNVTLKAEDNTLNYNWFNKENSLLSKENSLTIISLDESKFIKVKAIDNQGCESLIKEFIIIMDSVKAEFSTNKTVVEILGQVKLTNNSKGAVKYVWNVDNYVYNDKDIYAYYYKIGKQSVKLTSISPNNCEDILYKENLIDVISKTKTSLNDYNTPSTLIYPLPFNSHINVNSSDIIDAIEIYTTSAELINKIALNTKTKEYKVDLSNLRPGNYIIKIIYSDYVHVSKIIKL